MILLEKFNSGQKIKQATGYYAFVPNKINDIWKWESSDINSLLEKANLELGELNSFADLIPNVDVYIKMHIRTEANKSSRIEGTKTSIEEDMSDIKDISPEKRNDYIEVHNYINALNHGIYKITSGELPISSRLIKEIHSILLRGVRGENKYPGEYRISQNWIGGSMPSNAKHVPPPHFMLNELMSDLEKFIHNDDLKIPHLLKIAILHYQFETIHPFSDGNGRVGRLLIPLYLLDKELLKKPCFYISNFFEKNRIDYYDCLSRVREKNDILTWILFFLNGVISTAQDAKNKFHQVVQLVKEYENILNTSVKGSWENKSKILSAFYNEPILRANQIIEKTNLSKATINNILKSFIENNILLEKKNDNNIEIKRNKQYILKKYLDIFSKGIEKL